MLVSAQPAPLGPVGHSRRESKLWSESDWVNRKLEQEDLFYEKCLNGIMLMAAWSVHLHIRDLQTTIITRVFHPPAQCLGGDGVSPSAFLLYPPSDSDELPFLIDMAFLQIHWYLHSVLISSRSLRILALHGMWLFYRLLIRQQPHCQVSGEDPCLWVVSAHRKHTARQRLTLGHQPLSKERNFSTPTHQMGRRGRMWHTCHLHFLPFKVHPQDSFLS